MKLRYFLITAVLATAILGFAALPAEALVASPATTNINSMIAQLQAQIQSLMQQISALQAQQGTTPTWCHAFNTNLKIGDTGLEVGHLRNALVKNGVFSGSQMIDPPADIEFDEKLASSVVGFQEKYASEVLAPYGLKHGTGYVGKTTRAKLNQLYGCREKKECKTDADCAPINCIVAPCPQNKCVDGKCVLTTTISEQVKCVFNGSTSEQECYTATAQNDPYHGYKCSGKETCVVDIKGTQGDKITWKSSCGGYAYTVMDGQNEYAEFNCATATPSITVTSPNGGETYNFGSWMPVSFWAYGVRAGTIYDIDLIGQNNQEWVLASSQIQGAGDGSQGYKIQLPTSTNTFPAGSYKIRISLTVNEKIVQDISDNYFSIVSAINACTDSDGGLDYYVKGKAYTSRQSQYDSCRLGPGYNLIEAFCDNGTPKGSPYMCPNGCQDGACKKEEKSITVISPNGGETYKSGGSITVNWKTSGFDKAVINITDYSCSSELVKTIATNIPASQGSYSWKIPADFFESTANTLCYPGFGQPYHYGWRSGDNFKFFIGELKPDGLYGVQDESDNYFSIVSSAQPYIGIPSPNTGDMWQMGSKYKIIWFANNFVSSDKVNIILLDGRAGYSYYVIATDVPAVAPSGTYTGTPIGIYSWTVPSMGIMPGSTNPFKIYIGKYKPPAQSGDWESLKAAAESVLYGYGNSFNIVSATAAPIINDIRPSSIVQGQTLQVTLYGYNLSGASTTSGSCGLNPSALGGLILGNCNVQPLSVSVGITAANEATPGPRQFTITTPSGISNAVTFTVLSSSVSRSIKVFSPNGGEKWQFGQTYRIKWDSQGVDSVNIGIHNDTISGSGSANYITPNGDSIENIGYYDWTISDKQLGPMLTGDQNRYKISVSDSNYNSTGIRDNSDNYFSIIEATVEAPVITSILPSHGRQGETIEMVIEGRNFTGAKDYSACGIFPVNDRGFNMLSCIVDSDTKIKVKYSISSDAVVGSRYISVQTPKGGMSNKVEFTVNSSISCTDSDGGKNYYVKGKAYTSNQSQYDLCKEGPGYNLLEGICDNGVPKGSGFMCPNGCSNGACIQSTQPSITVTSPNGGEAWEIGKTYDITWTSNKTDRAYISWHGYNSLGQETGAYVIDTETPANVGRYSWTVPSNVIFSNKERSKILVSLSATATISSSSDQDVSDNYFSIAPATTGYNYLDAIQNQLASIADAIAKLLGQ